jgi:hypothetical protein
VTRAAAAVIALVALLSLAAQARVSWGLLGDTATAGRLLWLMAGYFTILSNALAALVLGRAALTGVPVAPVPAGALALSLGLVGIVYHLLLAGLWAPVGLAFWADQGLHNAMPALVVLWWWFLADKRGLRATAPLGWLAWPAAYLVYALIRGGLTRWYPYPFLDLAALGPGAVALNLAGLLLALGAAGTAMLGLARWRRGQA